MPTVAFGQDRRVLAMAPANRLCVLADEDKTLYVYNLALDTLAEAKSALVAKRGTIYEREVDGTADSTVAIEDAPDGVSWNAQRGAIRWDVPGEVNAGTYEVMLYIKSADGEERYETVEIIVE
jgi:hypothetical protein